MPLVTLCFQFLVRQRFRTFPRRLCFALALVGLCMASGCDHRKLPPELKYSPENVELIRKSLKMEKSADLQLQNGDANESGDSSADSGKE